MFDRNDFDTDKKAQRAIARCDLKKLKQIVLHSIGLIRPDTSLLDTLLASSCYKHISCDEIISTPDQPL